MSDTELMSKSRRLGLIPNGVTEAARSIALSAFGAIQVMYGEEEQAYNLRLMLEIALQDLPWRIEMKDWAGNYYALGGKEKHWSGEDSLFIDIKTPAAGRDILALDAMAFMEKFLAGEVDLEGNIQLLPEISKYAKLVLKPGQLLMSRVENLVTQDPNKAKLSVKSHYDIPEEALYYLDRDTNSYSCAIWEDPSNMSREEMLRVGKGTEDQWDSLEKAQHRKFLHAANWIRPAAGETVLDIGCGYGGFIRTVLENYRDVKITGWTHSSNQVTRGREEILAGHDPAGYELNEGDYRLDQRVYDHIHSTGMICHVGPEGKDSGLTNYVKEVRRRIRPGGRYVHHCMMDPHSAKPIFDKVGNVFNRKYVWPGFWFYKLWEHVKALEENGFRICEIHDLTLHYAKTTFAWYLRMVEQKEVFIKHTNEQTYRAWVAYLGGISGSYLNCGIHTMRIFCERKAHDDQPSLMASDPKQNPASWRRILI